MPGDEADARRRRSGCLRGVLPGDAFLEALTDPGQELRRHLAEVPDDARLEQRVLLRGRESGELVSRPDLAHAGEPSGAG